MSVSIKEVVEIVETLKSQEIEFSSVDIPVKHCKLGVIQASISLGKDFTIQTIEKDVVTKDSNGLDVITKEKEMIVLEDMTQKEIYLAGLYAFRNYFIQEHHTVTQKAVNFKTINFAVTGLTERAKEFMRIVWWTDGQIKEVLSTISTLPSGGIHGMSANVTEMKGDW